MTTVKPPNPFHVDADRNPADAFRLWKDGFEIFSEAAGLHKKPLSQQRAILLSCIGPLGLELYRELEHEIPMTGEIKSEGVGTPAKLHTCNDILAAIEKYYAPYRNTTQERYSFFTATQGALDIDSYVRLLKEKAKQCEFCSS